MFVDNICTICKDGCCVFEMEFIETLGIYDPENGFWWCGSCDCHSGPDWFDVWGTID